MDQSYKKESCPSLLCVHVFIHPKLSALVKKKNTSVFQSAKEASSNLERAVLLIFVLPNFLPKNQGNILFNLKVPVSKANQFQKYRDQKYNFTCHMANGMN